MGRERKVGVTLAIVARRGSGKKARSTGRIRRGKRIRKRRRRSIIRGAGLEVVPCLWN